MKKQSEFTMHLTISNRLRIQKMWTEDKNNEVQAKEETVRQSVLTHLTKSQIM